MSNNLNEDENTKSVTLVVLLLMAKVFGRVKEARENRHSFRHDKSGHN